MFLRRSARSASLSLLAAFAALAAPPIARTEDKAIGVGGKDQPARNWALIIGINGYTQAPLRYCVKDATLLADTLKGKCSYDATRVYLLTDGQKDFKDLPTRNNILDTARIVADLTRESDTLLVYFSGHGVTVDGKGYLVPIDARRVDTAGELVAIAELRDILRQAKAARRVLVLDACHSGGEKAGADAGMTKSFEDALKANAEGLVTLASCRVSETSLEADWHNQGLFTYWLVQGLSGQADREEAGNKDGTVEVTELYRFVYERVRAEAAKQRRHCQNPFFLAALSGKIDLAQVSVAVATLTPARRPQVIEQSPGADELTLDCGSDVNMRLKLIPAGEFTMGSSASEEWREDDETQRQVRISQPFYIGIYEVTVAQWQAVTGSNPTQFTSDLNQPVEQVSWDDCQAFCRALSQRTRRNVRLPTEAEWEYACRARGAGRFSFGDSESMLWSYAWYDGNSGHTTHPVGQKQPNAWGLYDMHGNLWEWCQDWYGPYPSGSIADPTGPSWSFWGIRVLRGGSWGGGPAYCRAANRNGLTPDTRSDSIGLRVVVFGAAAGTP